FNIAGKLVNHLIVFLINICIVRYLGATQSGIYFNELYLINFVALVFSLGIDFSVISFLAQDVGLLNALRKKMLIVLCIFASLLGFIAFIPSVITAHFEQSQLALFLFCVGNLMLLFYQGLLSAFKKFNEQNLVLIASNTVFLFFLFWMLHKPEAVVNFKSIAMANAVLFMVQGGLMQLLSYRFKSASISSISWKALLRPGMYFFVASLAYFSFLRIDNFFVERYCDPAVLGSYIQCGKIGQYFIYFSTIISSTMIPFIANETEQLSYKDWRKIMKPYLYLLLLAALGVIITGYFMFPFLFGNGFEQMYGIMLILLPGYIGLGLLTLMNAVYIGKGNLKRILTGDVLGFVLLTVLDIIFIPRYGVYAAAIISSICYVLAPGAKAQWHVSGLTPVKHLIYEPPHPHHTRSCTGPCPLGLLAEASGNRWI
ncbi:MAG: hypothetical protein EOP53_23270, partial [Sphingobacteriales bacterium]